MSKVKWFSIPDAAELLKCSPKTIRRRLDSFLSKDCPKLDQYYKKEDGATGKVYLSRLLLDSNFNPPITSNQVAIPKVHPLQKEVEQLQKEKTELIEKHREEVSYWKDQNDKLLDGQRELRILLMKEKESNVNLQKLISSPPDPPSIPKKGIDIYGILIVVLVFGCVAILGLGFLMGW